MKTKHKSQDQPLIVRVEGQQLVIRVGISTLAFCSAEAVGGPLSSTLKVVDEKGWAKDVMYALLREEEDGSNLINCAFDRAMRDAADGGSTALEEVK